MYSVSHGFTNYNYQDCSAKASTSTKSGWKVDCDEINDNKNINHTTLPAIHHPKAEL